MKKKIFFSLFSGENLSGSNFQGSFQNPKILIFLLIFNNFLLFRLYIERFLIDCNIEENILLFVSWKVLFSDDFLYPQ